MTSESGYSNSALLVTAEVSLQTLLKHSLQGADFKSVIIDNLAEASLKTIGQFDIYVVEKMLPSISKGEIVVNAYLDIHRYVRYMHEDNINFVVLSQGKDSELEEKCDELKIKFINVGTPYLPEHERMVEFVNYLHTFNLNGKTNGISKQFIKN